MRVMVLVKASEPSEAGVMPGADLLTAMGAFNQQLIDAGIMADGGGLKPTALGRRIAFAGEERTVIDGPFGPVGDQVAGFWIWNVADMDEAVAWARRCPNPMPVPSEIEIRPFYEAEDFA